MLLNRGALSQITAYASNRTTVSAILSVVFIMGASGPLLHAAAAATVTRPDSLLYVSFTDSVFPDAQPEQYAGIGAAFLEANEDPSVLLGTRLELMAVNASDEANEIAVNSTTTRATTLVTHFFQNESVAGFVANSQTLGLAISPLTPHFPMPIFGLNAVLDHHLNVSTVVQLRGFNTEFQHIVNFGMHRGGLHCTSLLMIHFNLGNMTDLMDFIFDHGFGYPDRIERPATTLAYDWPLLIAKLLQKPAYSCLIIVDFSGYIEILVPFIMDLPGFDRSTPILTVSFSGRPKFANPATLGNVYMTQVVPDPDDARSSRFVARYQRAMDRLFQTPFVNNSFDFARPVTFYNYQSLEGYIAGRLIVEGARGTLNLTRQGIVDTIYRQRMILLDDFSLGPYTRGCTIDASFPCDCHNGLRITTVSRISAATGKSVGLRDRPEEGEVDLAIEQAPLSECLVRQATARRPFNVLIPLPLPNSFGASEMWRGDAVRHFVEAFANASYGHSLTEPLRKQGSLRMVRATLSAADWADPQGVAVAALTQRYQPFAVVNGAPVTQNGTSLLATLGALPETPPAAESTLTGRFDLDGSVAEFAHALASYVERSVNRTVPAVVATTDAQVALVVSSLHSFGLQPPSVAMAPEAAAARAAIEALLRVNTPVLVVALDEAVLGAALDAIVGTAGTATVYVVAEEAAVYRATLAALQRHAMGRLAVPRPVLLASAMRPWWQASSFGKATLTIARRDPSDTPYAEDPAHAKAALLAEVVHQAALEALRLHSLTKRPASLAEALFSAGTLQAGGLTLGPFSNAACASTEASFPQRQCSCAKGPRTFFVHDLRDLLANSAASTTGGHHFTVKGCTIAYAALPMAATNNNALVAGLVGGALGLVAIATGAAVVVLCCFCGKSNRAAPKDENKPFAIAFTDIQSSTTLWARAPAEMAAAVEAHHTIIRQCLHARGGYEVKTIGDSFMVAFGTMADAARFAVRVQHALRAAEWAPAIDYIYRDMTRERLETDAGAAAAEAPDWDAPHVYAPLWHGLRVRVGVHFGFGRVVKDPTSGGFDYYGTVVNTAARVESVGNGGQVLLTAAAVAELLAVNNVSELPEQDLESRVAAALAEPVSVSALGPQPLRGLDVPVALFQLNPLALRARRFAPLRLDAEVGVNDGEDPSDDRGSLATHTTATGRSTFSTAADAAAAAASVLAPGDGAAFLEQFRLLETVLSTTTGKWRWDTLRSLSEAWRVRLPEKAALIRRLNPAKHPADVDGQASLLAVVELLKKVSRVHAARRLLPTAFLSAEDGHSTRSGPSQSGSTVMTPTHKPQPSPSRSVTSVDSGGG